MTLKVRLQADMAQAMRAGDTSRRDGLRMLLAAIKQTEIDDQIQLDDAGVQAVLQKQAKQRRESMADFTRAGRTELAQSEQFELSLIESYLPQMMSREEITEVAAPLIREMGVTDLKGMGQVMGKLMPMLKGEADGRLVSEVVRELIQNL